MVGQKAFGYFRCGSSTEISIDLQRRRVQEYCRAMNYELFAEITAKSPCTEQEAEAICSVIRHQMQIVGPLRLIVLNFSRINPDIHTVHRVSEVFNRFDITLESTKRADQEVLALSEQEEYDLFLCLAGSGFPAA